MNVTAMWPLVLPVFPLAVVLTWGVLRYTTRRNMIDVPGARSLHTAPTPRGGGLAIAVCILGGGAILTATDRIPGTLGMSLCAGGVIVAVFGWLDDRHGLPARYRAAGYLIAAALGVWLSGGLPRVAVGASALELGWAGIPVAVLAIAWLTNLYNFMDGADGIAAVQGISAGAFGAVLFGMGGQWGAATLCLILVAACAGFLIFNWPPARLFMGDVGSCLLGYSFGMLALYGERTGAAPLLAWWLLLLAFIMDASLTLALRMVRGEKWYSPHRTHAYQLLVQSGLGHRGLLLRFLLANFLMLGPLAVVAADYDLLPLAALTATIFASALWYYTQRRHGAS
ncbi:MAG: hypothetical protein A3H91_16985 [Gammaproteobacteria bacterium RIFCSPLOWO2_02_FULL_61_13]|nr:MAG: hypothetical protein A3H91_16985 [Gammaproteobacteria bacterium RIFCSPLOWO2_02_FULL_61_13]